MPPGKLQTQRNKVAIGRTKAAEEQKKTRREKRRGASSVGANVSNGRRPEPPSTGAESRSDGGARVREDWEGETLERKTF